MTDAYRLPVIDTHWRSLEELRGERPGTPDEFSAGASLPPEGLARRSLLQLASASLVASGLSGCFRRPSEEVLPYSTRPPSLTPGLPLHFATGLGQEGFTTGLVVRTVEGRPIKVEGNPAHPASLGATGAREQASLLELYDPDRARLVLERGTPRSRRALLDGLTARAAAAGDGARLRFLVDPSASPLLADVHAGILRRFPRAAIVPFAPFATGGAREAGELAFGRPLDALTDLSGARVIVSLDDDLLGPGPGSLRASRELARARVPPSENRLYVAECALSLTGSFADERLRLHPRALGSIARALARDIGRVTGHPLLAGIPDEPVAEAHQAWIRRAAADLLGAQGASLILVGQRHGPELHALGIALNEALGNHGATLRHVAPLQAPAYDPRAFSALVDELRAGLVDTLVITAWNPVYAAPAELGLAEALAQVESVVYRALYRDESAPHCTWFAPASHPFESWGDGRAPDGTATILQPLIGPLFDSSLDEIELLAPFTGASASTTAAVGPASGFPAPTAQEAATQSSPSLPARAQSLLGPPPGATDPLALAPGSATAPGAVPVAGASLEASQGAATYQRLRAHWRGWAGDPTDFDARWDAWLAEGVIPGTAAPTVVPTLRTEELARALRFPPSQSAGGTWLSLRPDARIDNGRWANNAWLQELPDPITQLTWGNAVLVSPAHARRLSVRTGQWVRLTLEDVALEAPVLIAPGHADDVVTLTLGHGRRAGGEIARNVGVDANRLRRADAPWLRPGLSIEVLDRHTPLALAQLHGRMEGRELALQTTRAAFAAHPEAFERLRQAAPRLYPSLVPRTGYQWGMAIDLNRCTGCSACVVACQAENNIPSVGREGVLRGRAMHWLRIDRYFIGSEDSPGAITQPVACVHCENAPCEYVCPVNATVHSDEGLNEMVYNRCVGTRYCSNNCPYKVRRFNFLEYRHNPTPLERMSLNPDVTVRSRGVMEKCTYCVQRIEAARITSRIERRAIRDGEVQTACQQVCPTEAITFGNLGDPDAAVRLAHADPRHYQLLHELGTQPRTVHLARLKNPGETPG